MAITRPKISSGISPTFQKLDIYGNGQLQTHSPRRVKQKALPTEKWPTRAPAQILLNLAVTSYKAPAEMSENLQEGFHGPEDESSSNRFQGTGGETWRARRVRSKSKG